MTEQPEPKPAAEHDEIQELKALAARYGQPILVALCIIVAIAVGLNIYRSRRAQKLERASTQLFQAATAGELQTWMDEFAGTEIAPIATLKLASTAFAEGNYQLALDTYESFLSDHAKHEFRPVALLGKAHCREALGQVRDALGLFEEFAQTYPDHFLRPEAMLGMARAMEQLGQLDNARIAYEDFIASHQESEWLPRAEDLLERLKNRMARGSQPAMTATPSPVETVMPATDPNAAVDLPAAAVTPNTALPPQAPPPADLTNATPTAD